MVVQTSAAIINKEEHLYVAEAPRWAHSARVKVSRKPLST